MNSTEVIYPDGSRSEFRKDGGATHDGYLAIERLRLLTAKSALSIYLRSGGSMQLTANGAQQAIKNVIEPLTGKTYKRSMNGKREALADCEALIYSLENLSVVVDNDPRCDICGFYEEDVDEWCPGCGCCSYHCQQFIDCKERP